MNLKKILNGDLEFDAEHNGKIIKFDTNIIKDIYLSVVELLEENEIIEKQEIPESMNNKELISRILKLIKIVSKKYS